MKVQFSDGSVGRFDTAAGGHFKSTCGGTAVTHSWDDYRTCAEFRFLFTGHQTEIQEADCV